MSAEPLLIAEPPLAPVRYPLHGATMRIGRGIDAGVRVEHPLVEARHAMLLEREDGWWLASTTGRVQLNGAGFGGEHRLQHGDRLTLAPGATLRFDSGVVAAGPPARSHAAAPISRARRRRWRMPRLSMPTMSWHGIAAWLAVGALLVIVGGFGYFAWTTWGTQPEATSTQAPLTREQATQFDSLLTVAYDHLERGQVLVEFGANASALDEFASGIAAITTSSLRNVPYVQQRVEALRASVADIYRARNLSVPGTYAAAKRTVSLATSGLHAALSVPQFAAAFAALQAVFVARYSAKLVVTGSDHPEHRSLYGPGGALDLRSSTLKPDQVRFVVDEARTRGIRVKDFSQDAILRAQIAAAIKAGLADRAGTGLHLHIDRFANRRDRYTVP